MKTHKDERAPYLAVGGITPTVRNAETVQLSLLDPSFLFLHLSGGNWTQTVLRAQR